MEFMKTHQFVGILKRFGIDPKTIFDVGSFDGKQAVELAEAFPDAEVLAFEPVPENVQRCLLNTIEIPKITLLPVAVGLVNGKVKFNQSLGNNKECGSLLKPNGKYWEPMPMKEIEVDCIRLDCVPLVPDVIWMDAQGTELDVLRSLGDILGRLKAFWAEVTYRAYYEGQPHSCRS